MEISEGSNGLNYVLTLEVPLWWPTLPPIYDINKTYLENALEGPFMHKQPILTRIESNNTQKLDFLGFKSLSCDMIQHLPLS